MGPKNAALVAWILVVALAMLSSMVAARAARAPPLPDFPLVHGGNK